MPVPAGASGFIVKLDKYGNFQWQKQVGDGPFSIGDQVMNLDVAPSGLIGVTGFMRSPTTQLEGLPPLETQTTPYSGFIAMMSPQGNFLWADKIVGTANVYSYHVQAFSNSDFVIGGYTSAADFGDGIAVPTGPLNREAYLARYQGFPYPEIAVEQGLADLASGGTAQDLDEGFIGVPGSSKTFTIRNAGTQDLTGITPTPGGTHPGDFTLDLTGTATTLAPGATTTFSVTFAPTALGARSASVMIASNDYDEASFVVPLTGTGVPPEITLAASPESMAEDGSGGLAFTFTRSGPTTNPLTVDFTVGGTAGFSTDYTQSGAGAFAASAGSVTFTAGSATAVVTLDPTADPALEPDETVQLTVSPGSGYTAGTPDTASATILNDDTEVSVAAAPSSLAEDAPGTLDFTLTRNGPLANSLTVNFSIGGTAGFGTDYTAGGADSFTASTATVTFAAGSATAVVTVDPGADGSVEADESVALTIAPGAGYLAVNPDIASATIINDDTDVSVAVSPSSVLEDGATNLVFTFSRVGVTNGALTVNFTVGGTAVFTNDYTQSGAAGFSAGSGTVGFAPGATTAVVTIDPVADQTDATDESVILTVAAGSGYNPGVSSAATGTILNDDIPQEITVEQPGGTGLTSGVSSSVFGSVVLNSPKSRTFTIRNLGTVPLTGVSASVGGTNASEFAVTQPAATVNGGGSTTFTVTFTPTASGTRNATLNIASNDTNENPFVIALSGTGGTAQQLLNNAMAAAGLTGPNAQATATPFGDGVSNLLKYAFNMNLAGPDRRTLVPGTGAVGLPVMRIVSGTVRYEFLRRKNSGINYTPQQSSNLSAAGWQAATGTTTVTSIDENWERVEIQQAPGTARFFRVTVGLP